jgi:hypothetical protein
MKEQVSGICVKVVGGGEMYYRRIFDLFIFIAFMVI